MENFKSVRYLCIDFALIENVQSSLNYIIHIKDVFTLTTSLPNLICPYCQSYNIKKDDRYRHTNSIFASNVKENSMTNLRT